MSAQSRWGLVLFGCFLLFGSSCWAATVQPVQGSFYLNQGQGFLPVNGPIDANVGDAIMVPPGAVAVVLYPDGCKVGVQPGAVTTITSSSPCSNPFGRDPTFAEETFNPNWAWGATAALAAAGLGVGIYAITKNNNNNSGTTTVNTGNSCGGPANPCYYAMSP